MIPVIEDLVLVENNPVVTESNRVSDVIFSKLKEVIDFPEGIQELTIKLSVWGPPVIDIVHLRGTSSKEQINTILTIKDSSNGLLQSKSKL